MIKDKLIYAKTYYGISENLKNGLIWIKNSDFNKLEDGKHVISETLYANIQTYETKDNALFEAHRDYIDIQYMISGEECIGVVDYNDCSTIEEYNKEKDIEFLSSNSENNEVIKDGEFVILFPHDAHKPSLSNKNKLTVRKAVVKVMIL